MIPNKIIDLLYTSVKEEGGDGDAIWLSKYTKLEDIIPMLEKYNEEHSTGWRIVLHGQNHISWGDNQEWVLITDSRGFYSDQPDWTILKIDC